MFHILLYISTTHTLKLIIVLSTHILHLPFHPALPTLYGLGEVATYPAAISLGQMHHSSRKGRGTQVTPPKLWRGWAGCHMSPHTPKAGDLPPTRRASTPPIKNNTSSGARYPAVAGPAPTRVVTNSNDDKVPSTARCQSL